MPTARQLDQFYTNPKIAKECIDRLNELYPLAHGDVLLEPSAGSGAFYNLLDKDKRIGLDLDPQAEGVICQDYYNFVPDLSLNYIVVGNPPFGKNSSDAVKFFNHSSFASVIGFVLPRTFRKNSIQNRLDLNFHLMDDILLPENSFIFNGEEYNVPSCFQIWSKLKTKREKVKLPTKHQDFDIVKTLNDTDFIIQRVGAGAGTVKIKDLSRWAKESHFYIKSNIDPTLLLDRFKSLPYDRVKYDTAGNPSVSASDIVLLYSEIVPLLKTEQPQFTSLFTISKNL